MSDTLSLSSVGNIFDVMNLKAPNGGVLDVTNTLVEANPLIKDLPALPANGGLFHKGSRVTSLPNGSLTDIGGYWGRSKAAREPFVEVLATIKDSWECPSDVLETEGPEASRALVASEKDLHIEGNGQAWCNLVVNGTSAPQLNAIDGFMKRATWETIDNEYCWDVGGSGDDLRSCWLIKPSPVTVHLLYNPNHPTLGITQKETPPWREADPDDSTKHRWMEGIEFMIQMGLCIRDTRAVKRVANIQCGANDNPTATLVNTIIKASLKHSVGGTQVPWFCYCDADLYAQLVTGANDVLKVFTSDQNIYQTRLPMIGADIIIRRLDALNHAAGSGETEVTT